MTVNKEDKTALQQIDGLMEKLPTEVQADIKSRLADWLSGEGATGDDGYVHQQLRYAKNVLKSKQQ